MEYKVPNHVAIIMDGNGRWAKNRGLKRTNGHKKGAEALKKISEYVYDKHIKILSVFAFSTENWKRDKEEVKKKNVKVIFSGVKEKLSDKVIKQMDKMMEDTKDNKNGIFNICLNYGGQDEIVEATKKISKEVLEKNIDIKDINKDMFNKYLFNDLPPIDLMIRNSGEYRISNFMLWQMAYSELYFTDTLWPDFDEKEFDKALDSYNKRDRRFGAVKEK